MTGKSTGGPPVSFQESTLAYEARRSEDHAPSGPTTTRLRAGADMPALTEAKILRRRAGVDSLKASKSGLGAPRGAAPAE